MRMIGHEYLPSTYKKVKKNLKKEPTTLISLRQSIALSFLIFTHIWMNQVRSESHTQLMLPVDLPKKKEKHSGTSAECAVFVLDFI